MAISHKTKPDLGAKGPRGEVDILKSFVENSPAAMVMVDVTMTCLAASHRWLVEHSVNAMDVAKQSLHKLLPYASQRWQQSQRRCLAGAVESCDADPWLRADGRIEWMRWEMRPWCTRDDIIGGLVIFSEVVTDELQADQAKIEDAERIQLLVNAANVGLWDWDLSTNVVRFSPEWKSQLGYGSDEIPDRFEEWETRLHPDDHERAVTTVQAYLASPEGLLTNEFRLRHKNGSYRWILAYASVLRDQDGKLVRMLGSHIDITDRKQEEEAARESRMLYETAFHSSPVGIALLTTDGRYVDVNERYAAMLGYAPADLIGHTSVELGIVTEKLREQRLREFDLHGDPSHPGEVEMRHRNGGVVTVLFSTIVLQLSSGPHRLSTVIDITSRKHSELALAHSEQRFRAIIEQSITGVGIVDQAGRLGYANPRLAAILGYDTNTALIGRPLLDFIAPQDHAAASTIVRSAATGEPAVSRHQLLAVRQDGSHVLLGTHGVAGTYEDAPAFILSAQDITELRRAELAVERTVEQLQRTVQSTIEVVSAMGAVRDPYTHGHERRVGEIAAAIAGQMGLSKEQVQGVRVAGYLHDVGKIAVPVEVLAKPTRLSEAEFSLVKEHAHQGYEILRSMDFPWPVAEVARQHHERLDGSGYPRNLKGDAIILEARIIAVADTVEAMATDRPYRPGLGLDMALDEIARGNGRLYDPVVAGACLELFRVRGYQIPS